MKNSSREALIVIATALPVEFQAVSKHLGRVVTDVDLQNNRYELGWFSGARVAVVATGQGNVDAAIRVEAAIQHYNPRYLFFVGVAGGLKDVSIGDVVAATKIYNYEAGKLTSSEAGEKFLPRPKMGESSHLLVELAQQVSRATGWRLRTDRKPPEPESFVAPLVSGEKVIDAPTSTEVQMIRATYSDALALEMEGFGVLRVSYAREEVRMIVIRGISDMLSGKAAADSAGSQGQASVNAAAFAFEMIEQLLADRGSIPIEAWSRLEELLLARYPAGPTHDEIWSRAGGDLSTLELGQNGRASWHSSMRKLRLGGGGRGITFHTLLACIDDDYPSSPEVAELIKSI